MVTLAFVVMPQEKIVQVYVPGDVTTCVQEFPLRGGCHRMVLPGFATTVITIESPWQMVAAGGTKRYGVLYCVTEIVFETKTHESESVTMQ